ncbi:MAG: hypothetical protein CMD68_00720 [Gammaproteobacteria bacterium]|nr:hypothetical protein [Gammaproteobacteria bacterium]|tara:strand:+ start:122 stop:373 length:252 start_codon:yes stop_codon:yes gene_type:complete
MATKDSFEAFIGICMDKINQFTENSDQPNIKIIQKELKDKLDELIKSQGYVSKEEYQAIETLAKRLEKRVSKLENFLKNVDIE